MSLLTRLAQRRKGRRVAMVATAALVAGGLTVTVQGIAHAAVACQVNYTANTWTEAPGVGGFTANITINNTGDPITSWTLEFDLPAGQSITQLWNGNVPANASGHITVTNAWNRLNVTTRQVPREWWPANVVTWPATPVGDETDRRAG